MQTWAEYCGKPVAGGKVLAISGWVVKQDGDLSFIGTIEPCMLEPLVEPGRSGYVPLCAALHWIMTGNGTRGYDG